MAPWDLAAELGDIVAWAIYLLIGFAFGFILESAGFADARLLAAQFYWREIRVIQVMFTAILVAMVLIFWSSALGWLDYDDVWVNPTYIWPGIVGGLIMGVGFVFAGFCPGTSLVGVATLKVDAIWFVAGAAVGIISFGETVSFYNDFWHSGFLGRFTLQDWLGLPTGAVVLGLVVMSLLILWIGDIVRRRIYGDSDED
jgi:hypothetical protein